jgi:hypothetical protein
VQPYLNRSGDSGVVAYDVGPDYIRVRFRGGGTYQYSYASAGQHHVEQMKTLATAGRGLSTYISQHVRRLYDSVE